MRAYQIEVWDRGGWRVAHRLSVMSRSAAEGLLSQFALRHRARLVNGKGRVLGHRGANRQDAQNL